MKSDNINKAEKSEATTASVVNAAEFLAKLAGASLGLVAIASLLGWVIARAYFQSLGAAWVMNLLTPNLLLQWAYPLLAAMLSGLVLGSAMVVDGLWSGTALKRADLVVALLASTLMVASLFDFLGSASMILGRIGAYLFQFGLGFFVVRIVFATKVQGFRWSAKGAGELYMALLVILTIQIPFVLGARRAEMDATETASSLPIAEVDGVKWRILVVTTEEVVLVNFAEHAKPKIRIVRHDSISSITNP